MKIGFIGAGKVGCSLGKYLQGTSGDWELMGYYSRSITSAVEAAEFTGSRAYEQMEELVAACEVLFLTTTDAVIADVWEDLCNCKECLAEKMVVHCSGSLASTIFAGAQSLHVSVASFHPLYAVADRFSSYQGMSEILFTLEGSGTKYQAFLSNLSASGLMLQEISAESKTRYHAAATVASNLMIGLAELAFELLESSGFDRENAKFALRPLIEKNMKAVFDTDTWLALTGPAERADVGTVQKHMQQMQGENQEIYRMLTKKIVRLAKKKHPDRDYAVVEKLLQEYKEM